MGIINIKKKTRTTQAIQFNGENREEIREFVKDDPDGMPRVCAGDYVVMMGQYDYTVWSAENFHKNYEIE